MAELNRRQRGYLPDEVLEEVCQVHGCRLWGKKIPLSETYLRFCSECGRMEAEARNQEAVQKALLDIERQRKYGMLERESVISPELRLASLETFQAVSPAELEGLEFARGLARYYYEDGVGNAILSGRPGVGKSHLALSVLRALNEAYAKKEAYRSAIFMPVAQLFSLLTDGFDNPRGLSEARAVKLLTACDFLVLDDLGKESTYSHELKRANNWKQSVLFQILDNRERTIVTTNFEPEQLGFIYDPALYDRLLKGPDKLKIRFDETMVSRR